MRKEYSNYRAQSSSNRSVCPHRRDEEVDQLELRTCLDHCDLRPRINNCHCERDNAKWERCYLYDEEYGVPGANCDCRPRGNDYDPADDLDGFSAFSDRLRAI